MATTYTPTAPGTLVTRREIGEMLGVKRQRVHQIVSGGAFPAPVDVCWSGDLPVWLREDVERWRAEHRPPAEKT